MSFARGMGYGVRAWLGALLLLLGVFSTGARAGTPSLSEYMDCARGIGVTLNERFAILPGARAGERGLYLYTDRRAYFLPLGTPNVERGAAQEFFLRTTVSGVGEILIDYRDKKPGNAANIQPGIAYQTTAPAASVPGYYRLTPASDSADERATEVLRQRLREKVATIKNFIDDKNRYSTPTEAQAAFEKDRAIYLAKLGRCRIEGDRGLNAVVVEEMQKLESAFPAATIWEKEITGRMSLSMAR